VGLAGLAGAAGGIFGGIVGEGVVGEVPSAEEVLEFGVGGFISGAGGFLLA
jgi:hypothetical protein